MNIKQIIKNNILNIPGWRTNHKIVVIESDDWGSIRMPSLEVSKMLLKNGVNLYTDLGYDLIDTIASREDLQNLFEVCKSVRDKNGNPAIITANAVVANPNFEKIKASDFQEYHYEIITETMDKYYPNVSPFPVWKQGINEKVFYPQFHGREHLNVSLWLNVLKKDIGGSRLAFDNGVFSQVMNIPNETRNHVLAAYDYRSESEREFVKNTIYDGLNIFEDLFGYRSLTTIAPCYVWDSYIENCFSENGVKFFQGSLFQTYTTSQKQKTNKKGKYHSIGNRNIFGQRYLVRNCYFEPSQNPGYNYLVDCLSRINIAFRWGKPAIISAHRLNFIGELDIKNRNKNLIQFSELLSEIVKRWPEVEFMSTEQLGTFIIENNK